MDNRNFKHLFIIFPLPIFLLILISGFQQDNFNDANTPTLLSSDLGNQEGFNDGMFQYMLPDSIISSDTPENFLKLNNTIYTGGEPKNEKAFSVLAAMGITTIVSVDGARPDIKTAEKYNLRYLHIPIGYDAVDDTAGLLLTSLVRKGSGPYFIHCHHGKHRGPAAAAIAGLAAGEIGTEEAMIFLETAGTSKNYPGLWESVSNFEIPEDTASLPDPESYVPVSSFVTAMAQIDRAYDNLKFIRRMGWNTPDLHPDLVPHKEALIVREGFYESLRTVNAAYDQEFYSWLTKSDSLAASLQLALEDQNHEVAEKNYQLLKDACKKCHDRYRN